MSRVTASALAVLVCLGVLAGCGDLGSRGEAPGTKSSDAATETTPSSATAAVSPTASAQPIDIVWRQYLGTLISCDVPRLMEFRSSPDSRSYAEGDLVYVCDGIDDHGLEVSDDEATGEVTFHVVEIEYSTGMRESVDRDVEYVVRFKREADGVWRVVEMPDGLFTLR